MRQDERLKDLPITGKQRLGFDCWKESPFLIGEKALSVQTRKRSVTVAKGTLLKSLENESEDIYETSIAQVKQVDDEEFVKIFTKNIRIMLELESAGSKVFFVLLSEVQNSGIGVDKVFITWHRIEKKLEQMKDLNFSYHTYLRGLKELIEKQVIANSEETDWFYINPAILFNGDRARFVNEVRRTKRGKIENKNQARLQLDEEEF